jgi:hypothetical protein
MAVSVGIAVIVGVSVRVGVDEPVLAGVSMAIRESPGVSVGVGVIVMVESGRMAVLAISEFDSGLSWVVGMQPSKPGIISHPIITRFINGSLRTHRNDTVRFLYRRHGYELLVITGIIISRSIGH